MEEVGVTKLMSKPRKTSEGKKKIDVTKKVMNKTSRQVMFSKRRKGLFKKCDELCSKHGAQIALITFSEAGNFFTFGNPNLDYILNRYLNCSGSNVINHVNNVGANCCGFWWDEVEIDKLGLSELEEFKVALERLRNEVGSMVNLFSSQGFGFDDNSIMKRSGSEVVSSVVDMKRDYSLTNQGFGFDNSMDMSIYEDASNVIIDGIKHDFSMTNQGLGFEDFDFGGVFDGRNFNDEFGSDFDFGFGDLINNNDLVPEVHHVPDTSLLQHLQVN